MLSAPAVNPAQVQSIFVSQKGLDDAGQYQLYRVEDDDHSDPIPLRAEIVSFQKELRLTPEQPLAAGTYLITMPTGGMFAGREFYYFSVDPAVAALPPIVASPAAASGEPAVEATAPSEPWLVVLPLVSALLSAALALVMLRRLRRRVRPHEAAWSVAFVLFALAAGSQVIGDVRGWTPLLARLYYVTGATLVVGWLGLGTWLLLVHKPWQRNAGVWAMLVLSGYAIGLVSLASVDAGLLSSAGWHALQKPAILTVLTIGLNIAGTSLLVGGALYSAWVFWRKDIMRQRMIGCILLAAGALLVAAGGSLTRLGHQQYLYMAMSAGIAVIFWGYLKTIAPERAPSPLRQRSAGVETARAEQPI